MIPSTIELINAVVTAQENHQGIGGTDCCQRIFSCKSSCNHTICDIVNLLEHHAEQHWQKEPP